MADFAAPLTFLTGLLHRALRWDPLSEPGWGCWSDPDPAHGPDRHCHGRRTPRQEALDRGGAAGGRDEHQLGGDGRCRVRPQPGLVRRLVDAAHHGPGRDRAGFFRDHGDGGAAALSRRRTANSSRVQRRGAADGPGTDEHRGHHLAPGRLRVLRAVPGAELADLSGLGGVGRGRYPRRSGIGCCRVGHHQSPARKDRRVARGAGPGGGLR